MSTIYNDIAQSYDFIHRVGNDDEVKLLVVDPAGVAKDLTGHTFTYVIQQSLGGTVWKTITGVVVGNLVTFSFTDVDNAVRRNYWYELKDTITTVTKTWFAGRDKAIVGTPLDDTDNDGNELTVTVNTNSTLTVTITSVIATTNDLALKISLSKFIVGEPIVESGGVNVINGVNATFVIPYTIIANKEKIYLGNLPQFRGVDYTISGSTFVMTKVPEVGDSLFYDCIVA